MFPKIVSFKSKHCAVISKNKIAHGERITDGGATPPLKFFFLYFRLDADVLVFFSM